MINFAELFAETPAGSAAHASLYARVLELQQSYAELRVERDQLAARALRDPLTGALSRSVFHEELSRALLRLARHPRPLAVLFVDLDRLKQVNDCHGHAAGDEMIRVAVERLRASVRPSDAVARIGGDEFVVLLDDLSSEAEAEAVAQRVLHNMCAPLPAEAGVTLRPSASVGVALAGRDADTADVLLSHADAAMYTAKQRGRGRYALFDAAAYSAANARVRLESELRRAVPAGQLELHYQPIFNLTTGSRHAVEALLRWQHPSQGLLAADAFIDVADDSGLLAELSPWVIDEACGQMAQWDRMLSDRAPERMFLNLSVGELVRPDLDVLVRTSLARAGVDASRLVIEVTESGMLDKPGSVAESVDRLLRIGCSVAIDDFGTGYSALSRLVELPADILKIDRSFVQRLGSGQEPAAIVAAVLLLAHNLRKTVVAEGIENAQALATLSELGCEHGQGFYLGRPAPADVITAEFSGQELALT